MNLLSSVLVVAQAVAGYRLDSAEPSPAASRAAALPVTAVAREAATPPGLPALGKWMLDGNLDVAHWLGMKVRGKQVREPINLIVLDRIAASADEATQRLLDALRSAGFAVVSGHSSGYHAMIGWQVVGQLPSGSRQAFADGPPDRASNHGRMFGPVAFDRGFLFTGAFSLEVVSDKIAGHLYGSFDHARDNLATRLDEGTTYHVAGYVGLDNAIIGDPLFTTGDHDGIAVLLEASSQAH